MFSDVHHIGYRVKSLDESIAAYQRAFGSELLGRSGAIAFMRTGDTMVELMEPADKTMFDSTDAPILHHVGYLVPDLAAAVKELESKGLVILDKTPRVNFMGWKIVYFEGGPGIGVGLHVTEV